jgi:predicted dienelactone hydrolase
MVQFGQHALSGDAVRIPIRDPVPVVSYSPAVLKIPGRRVEMQLRVTAPATGTNLPILLLSHGHGTSSWLSSLDGYGPMHDFYAAHGFVVLQPTHLSSKFLSLNDQPEHEELFWRTRAQDMIDILDRLEGLENEVPLIKGRLDKSKIAVFGHSLGAWTAGMLLGVGKIHATAP